MANVVTLEMISSTRTRPSPHARRAKRVYQPPGRLASEYEGRRAIVRGRGARLMGVNGRPGRTFVSPWIHRPMDLDTNATMSEATQPDEHHSDPARRRVGLARCSTGVRRTRTRSPHVDRLWRCRSMPCSGLDHQTTDPTKPPTIAGGMTGAMGWANRSMQMDHGHADLLTRRPHGSLAPWQVPNRTTSSRSRPRMSRILPLDMITR